MGNYRRSLAPRPYAGLVVAQSAIDENHRCTDLVHACLYEYEETGKRELELQVGKHRGDVVCDEFRLWFLMLRDDPMADPLLVRGGQSRLHRASG